MSCLLLSYSFFDFFFILIILVNHGLSTAPQEPVQLLAWSKAKIENAGVGSSSLAKGYDSGPPSLHPWRI
jgi:hypothetical protein